jgi:hypothetical protein
MYFSNDDKQFIFYLFVVYLTMLSVAETIWC